MEKYYTPTIEEFHTEFEYEYLQPGGKWVKHNLDGSPIIHRELDEFKDDLMKLAHAITRVKYLDKEDIESLGWSTTSGENYRYFINDSKSELNFPQIVLRYNLNNQYDIFRLNIEGGDSHYIFRGTIKNKSELKVLMKQLNLIK